MNCEWELTALVPSGVVTVTSTVPALPAGAVALIVLGETMSNWVAAANPKATDVAPAKLPPLIVTTVPPSVGPLAGSSAVTNGTGAPPTGSCSETAAPKPPAFLAVSLTATERFDVAPR